MRTTRIAAAVLILLGLADVASAQRPAPKGAKVVRDLEFARVGDRSLALDLYLPEEGEGPFPVLVAIHGGAWLAGDRNGAMGIDQAGRGYAVASITYRLSQAARFPAQIEDCKAAVRWLRDHAGKYNLDPDRFGAIGHSAGGHLASLLGTTGDVKEFDKGDHLDQSSRIQAVCALSGPSDLLQMGAHAPKDSVINHDAPDAPEAKLIGGAVQENKEKAAKANPITYISRDDPPFLLIHGDADNVVPCHQSELMVDALKKAGIPAELYKVPGAGHGIGGKEVNERISRFLDANLRGKKPAGG
ncbi:MAG: alpha/beta hydrolase [Isosphaeraceae bacterium]